MRRSAPRPRHEPRQAAQQERCGPGLEGCEVDGLGGVDGLRGARITWPDAMALRGPLVAAAGFVILGDPESAGRA